MEDNWWKEFSPEEQYLKDAKDSLKSFQEYEENKDLEKEKPIKSGNLERAFKNALEERCLGCGEKLPEDTNESYCSDCI